MHMKYLKNKEVFKIVLMYDVILLYCFLWETFFLISFVTTTITATVMRAGLLLFVTTRGQVGV